jgi:hypothetical protein
VLDQAAFDPRQACVDRGCPRGPVHDDVVIVDVRDGPADVPVDAGEKKPILSCGAAVMRGGRRRWFQGDGVPAFEDLAWLVSSWL